MQELPLINSLTNDRIKAIRALGERKRRSEAGLFVAEGRANLDAARLHGIAPATLVVRADAVVALATDIAWARAEGASAIQVPKALMAKITGRNNPPPIVATYAIRHAAAPANIVPRADAAWLALEGVRDPGNLGTILRTAHGVGLDGVMLIGPSCDPFAPDCVQAAMGSVFAVPVAPLTSADFLSLAQRWPGRVIGTHLAGSAPYTALPTDGPLLVVMGSEGSGLTPAIAAACRTLVRIPMRPGVDSLNLAVATGVILYHLLGQRL